MVTCVCRSRFPSASSLTLADLGTFAVRSFTSVLAAMCSMTLLPVPGMSRLSGRSLAVTYVYCQLMGGIRRVCFSWKFREERASMCRSSSPESNSGTHVVVVGALQDEGDVDRFVAVVDDGGRLHRDAAQRHVTGGEEALESATRRRP